MNRNMLVTILYWIYPLIYVLLDLPNYLFDNCTGIDTSTQISQMSSIVTFVLMSANVTSRSRSAWFVTMSHV